jgi:hypothetical protein
MTERYNFRSICDLTERVLQLPKGALKDKSRKRPLQIGRQVAAMIGRLEEDIHHKEIANCLDRNRSLIYHYEKTHEGNYMTWSLYKDSFNKVYKAYKDLEGEKNVFIMGSDIKNYLLLNGVKEAPKFKDDVLLSVKSGNASCIIKTTYLDFSIQLENIRLALQDYHYTINII